MNINDCVKQFVVRCFQITCPVNGAEVKKKKFVLGNFFFEMFFSEVLN